MPIHFDDSVANALIHASRTAASMLRSQAAALANSSANLFTDFKGAYAARYHWLRGVDTDDRVKLAFALQELARDVAIAKH